jgi:hypothetical protein
MFGTRRFWGTFAAIETAVVVASVAAAVAGGSFWMPLLCGTVAAFGLSWIRERSEVGSRRTEEAFSGRHTNTHLRTTTKNH